VPLLMLAIVLFAIARSAIATRLDSFTIDENYHIAAGVSYVRNGDFRINPEHPPLVKLWVGAFMPRSWFHMGPLSVFSDKDGERTFTSETVFLQNDPDRVQRRSRLAMFCFNGLALFVFGLVARRIFGSALAIGALIFLAIDPTVAAHLPVVMTDLPIALLGSIALLLAWLAFTTWKPWHLLAAATSLGLALATKHSGIIIAEAVTVLGLVLALRSFPADSERNQTPRTRPQRLFAVALVLFASVVVLWGTYGFRYTESGSAQETFNRPLAGKISDLRTPGYRSLISTAAKYHLLPRAYLWGFADIIRAGVEGRGFTIFFMDRTYGEHRPRYFFPVQILVKVPIGFLVLSFTGLAFFLARKLPIEIRSPLWTMLAFSAFFLFTLAISNSYYAGVRHAMPVYPTLALLAGASFAAAFTHRSLVLKSIVLISAVAACISAVPILRPWEYHNVFAGGTARAYLHFSDEGIDLGLRRKEFAAYYHQQLEPKGELPYFLGYLPIKEDLQARGVRTINDKWEDGTAPDDSDTFTGTVVAEDILLHPDATWISESLLKATPIARFGNLMVYRGTFYLPKERAFRFFFNGIDALYSPQGSAAKAESLIRQATVVNADAFFAWIELGNLQAKRGDRAGAIESFQKAFPREPDHARLQHQLENQIHLLQTAANPASVPSFRNPMLE
jgi:hypothetical protein